MAANPTKNTSLFDRKSGVTTGYPALWLDAVIFHLNCVMLQSLQYGGIHDSHFKYIQTTITSLFLDQF